MICWLATKNMKLTDEQYEGLANIIVSHYDMGSYQIIYDDVKLIDSSYKINRNLDLLITLTISEESRKIVITSDEYGRKEMGAYRIANYCTVLSYKFFDKLFEVVDIKLDKNKLEKLIEDKLPIGELL